MSEVPLYPLTWSAPRSAPLQSPPSQKYDVIASGQRKLLHNLLHRCSTHTIIKLQSNSMGRALAQSIVLRARQ